MHKGVVFFLLALFLAAVKPAEAQQTGKIRVIGILSLTAKPTLRDEVFERTLRELGWIEGHNIRIEYRRAANKIDRLSALAEELVRLKVDLIVASATPAVQAAKNDWGGLATATVRPVLAQQDCPEDVPASQSRPPGAQ